MSVAHIHSGLHSLGDSPAPHGGREGRRKRREKVERKERVEIRGVGGGIQMRAWGRGVGEVGGGAKTRIRRCRPFLLSEHPERHGGILAPSSPSCGRMECILCCPPLSRSIIHFQTSVLSQSVSGPLPHPEAKDVRPCAYGKEEATGVAPALLVAFLSSSRISDGCQAVGTSSGVI